MAKPAWKAGALLAQDSVLPGEELVILPFSGRFLQRIGYGAEDGREGRLAEARRESISTASGKCQ